MEYRGIRPLLHEQKWTGPWIRSTLGTDRPYVYAQFVGPIHFCPRTDLLLDCFEKCSSLDLIYFCIVKTGGSDPKLGLFENIIKNYNRNIQ